MRSLFRCVFVIFFIICSQTISSQPINDLSKFCEYSALLANGSSSEKKEREKLYTQLLGILDKLNNYRIKLSSDKKYIDIFPAIYSHVTSIEADKIRKGLYKEPEWKMNQMIGFFEAYEVNRNFWDIGQKSLVEPHWVNHFQIAESTQTIVPILCQGFTRTMLSAIDAHIQYDLPRSIRFTDMQYAHSANISWAKVKEEYDEVKSVFDLAQQYSLEDLKSISPSCSTFADWFSFASPDIPNMRNQSWLDAKNKNHEISFQGTPLVPHPYDLKLRNEFTDTGKNMCKRQVSSLLFLFDLSGSMNGNGANSSKSKLQQAKDASKVTLNSISSNQLGAEPEVGVLGFSGGCPGPNSDPTTGNPNWDTDFQTVQKRIDELFAGGGTPLYEAIEAAQCKLAKRLQENNQKSGKLIVLSDGAATCKKIRPQGVYNSTKVHQWKIDVDANKCGGAAAPKIKYYTIGFNINPGSPAERDLQFLAQSTGGKYLNVQSQTQLERAFRKFNRTYIPKPKPALSNLPSSSNAQFDTGVSQINSESFTSALETYEAFAELHTDDCHGAYNLALMQEANDFYKKAIANYQQYLLLCPNAADKDFVEKQIMFLEEEFKQFLLFQKEVVKSDLEYLKLHFKKIQNGQSVALAEEFKGFLKEKGDYYINLPELMGRTDRLFKKNSKEVADGLENCAKTINRNPETWDRDATPALSMTYLNLERLLDSL